MPIKKSELYNSLWKSCDELRGGMDASQYKDYVLVLLFVKYVSDKYAGKKDALIEVPQRGSFSDMVALKGDKEIGDKMNKIIGKLAKENELKGVIDVADFNNDDKLGKGKEMVDKLSKLIAIFENPGLDFRSNRAEGDDILGDAYEYLMRHFATESGKSKGQFYTPAEVSRVIAKVIGISYAKSQSQTIYDPTCGSGSLLLKAADESQTGVTIYGQEMDNATAALAKMNMILHDNPTAEIWKDNTLSSPHFKQPDGTLKTFDFTVANPPFSFKSWKNGFDPVNDLYERFEDGIPPAKNGDYAFLLHIIKSLKSTGKGAVILPHGVLFRGNVEADIRKKIIRRGYIKGIIGLPANLFYGTGIPACIIVLDKQNASARTGIFMIDASKGFMKDGNKNRLRHQDLHKIMDVFNKQLEIPKYSRMVPVAEISNPKNDYNLNIPRYIDSTEPEDLQYIDGHLRGGIPNPDIDDLIHFWQVFPSLKAALFTKGDRPGYSQIKVDIEKIKNTIFSHPEFVSYMKGVESIFGKWRKANISGMKGIAVGDRPKVLVEELSETMLKRFSKVQLMDPYTIYQHLMTYWTDVMQDDVYAIVADDWEVARTIRVKKKKGKVPEIIGEIIPSGLIINRYFASEQETIDKLEAQREEVINQMEELIEETGGQESPLEALRTQRGIGKGAVQDRAMEIKKQILESKDSTDKQKKLAKTIQKDFGSVAWKKGVKDEEDQFPELDILYDYLQYLDKESGLKGKIKIKQIDLAERVVKKYSEISVNEIKVLVVEDKWLASMGNDIQTEVDRVSQALTGRIKELAKRYENTLPKLTEEVKTQSAKVNEHLKKMGFVWK